MNILGNWSVVSRNSVLPCEQIAPISMVHCFQTCTNASVGNQLLAVLAGEVTTVAEPWTDFQIYSHENHRYRC